MRERKPALPPIQQAMEVTSPPALEALVERAGKGDADAFRTLFDRYGERVYRYCCSRVGQRARSPADSGSGKASARIRTPNSASVATRDAAR